MIPKPTNSKYLLVLIAVLLAANIIGIVYFISNKPNGGNAGGYDRKAAMVNYLKKDLGFSDAQLLSYDSLEQLHWQGMKPLFDTLRKEKEKRIRYIANFGFEDSAISTAVAKTAVKQQLVETSMLMHVKNIRNLCTPAQKIMYDTSIYKMFVRKTPEKK
jgi:hypothetical protein